MSWFESTIWYGREAAKRDGFTHHASVYFVPCWFQEDKEAGVATLATKFPPMDLVLLVINTVDYWITETFFNEREPMLGITVKDKIED